MTISKKIAILIFSLFSAAIIGIVVATPIFADGESFNNSYLLDRVIAVDIMSCYDGHMVPTVTLGDKPSATKIQDLVSDNQKVTLPTDFAGANNPSCKNLLAGGGGFSGVLNYSSTIKNDGLLSDDQAVQGDFLKKLGYEPTGSTDTEQCGRLKFLGQRYFEADNALSGGSSSYSMQTASICGRVDSKGSLQDGTLHIKGSVEGLPEQLANTNPIQLTTAAGGQIHVTTSGQFGVDQDLTCSGGENFKGCLDKLVNIIKTSPIQTNSYKIDNSDGTSTRYYLMYTYSETEISETNEVSNEFKLSANAGKTAAKNLMGRDNTAFLSEEIRSMYQIYLNNSGAHMVCEVPDDKKSEFVNSGYIDKPVKLVKDGKELNNCYVNAVDGKYNGFSGQTWSTTADSVSLNDILDFLASSSVSSTWINDIVSANAEIYGEEDDTDSGGLVDPDDIADADEVNCFNSAGALGWIICPIISFVQDTITAIYDSIITNFLTFNADNIQIGGNVYKAWQTFQSIANIAFVIVLLIVIFSQVTGFGIDNLGIKRVLPKLIVAAILINLSFIICQIAVDISNILGVGLNTMFANISVTAQTSGGGTASAALSTIMTAAVGGAVGALAVGTAGIWGAVIIIPLLLGLVTTLFGILFFFVILGARQALIIIMIVLSPVAFACYMLPNTKSIFDRWLKAFEALLLVFPICGLLMGGSAFASDVLMTLDTGFLGKLIAMLVGVVPFFFIPTLLRGSMSALGNIGARISGFGNNMSRRITGAAANSDTVRDAQARARAGIDMNGNPTRLAQWRQNIAQGNSRLSRIPGLGGIMQRASYRANARSNAARVKYLDERRREERLNDPGFFDQYERSQQMALEKEELNTAIDNVNYSTDKGENQSELFKIYDNALASGDVTRMRAVAEIAGRRKDTANAFIQKFKNDSEQGRYAGKDDMIQKVAKQIATGDNSKNYRASNAMGFEYASQITQGNTAAREANGGIMSYDKWKNNAENVHSALDHHVTNGSELYGQSNASLRELNDLATNHMAKGKNANGEEIDIEHNDKEYLGRLAQRAEREGAEMGGAYDESKTDMINALKSNAPVINQNDAQPGQNFNIQGASTMTDDLQPNRIMSDAQLIRLRDHYQEKLNNGTETINERNTLDTINQEIVRRQNERNSGSQENNN